MWGLPTVSYHSTKFGGHRYFGSSDIILISFFMWPHNQKVTWSWSWGPSITSWYSVKFGGHRYCGSADIRSYICHETTRSKSHVTKCVGSSDRKVPLCQVWGPYVLRKYISFFHLSCDHIIKNSRNFEDWVPPPQVTTLPSLVAIDIAEVQI